MEMVKGQGLFPAWQELSCARGFVCRFVPSMFSIWVCKRKKASQSPVELLVNKGHCTGITVRRNYLTQRNKGNIVKNKKYKKT